MTDDSDQSEIELTWPTSPRSFELRWTKNEPKRKHFQELDKDLNGRKRERDTTDGRRTDGRRTNIEFRAHLHNSPLRGQQQVTKVIGKLKELLTSKVLSVPTALLQVLFGFPVVFSKLLSNPTVLFCFTAVEKAELRKLWKGLFYCVLTSKLGISLIIDCICDLSDLFLCKLLIDTQLVS